jgi:hypothetical protein
MNPILEGAHTQRAIVPLSLELESQPEIKIHKFDEVYSAVDQLNQLNIPSPPEIRTLADLEFEDADVVNAPGIGRLRMTDWAQRRIGSMMGVKWSKFFGPMEPDAIKTAITSHLNGVGDKGQGIKLVSRELMESESYKTDGILRGVVSPSYSEFRDVHALDRLYEVAGSILEVEWGFTEVHLLDSGSYFNLIHTYPFPLIPGSGDTAYVGLQLRNSEVGAHSWEGIARVLRLVCVNGMMVPLFSGKVFRFIHKGMQLERIDQSIEEALDQCYQSMEQLPPMYGKLLDRPIDEPEEHLRSFLESHNVSLTVRDAVVDAYATEEIEGDNAYRALQAITRMSPALRDDPQRQRDIEILAGQYTEHMLQ